MNKRTTSLLRVAQIAAVAVLASGIASKNWFQQQIIRFRSFPHLDRAYQLMSAGRLSEARAELEQYLKLNGLDTSARLSQMELLIRTHDYSALARAAGGLLALQPDNCAALVYRAVAEQRLGELDAALTDFERVAHGGCPAERVFALRSAAEIASWLQRYDAAINAIERLPRDMLDFDMLMLEADALSGRGSLAQAARTLRSAIDVTSRPGQKLRAHKALALLLTAAGDHRAAVTELNATLPLAQSPSDRFWTWMGIGDAFTRLRDFHAAADAFARAAQIEQDPRALRGIAMATRTNDGSSSSGSPYGSPGTPLYDAVQEAFSAMAVKDLDAGIQALRKAISIAPGRPELRKELAHLFIRTGQTEEAVEAFKDALALNPADCEVRLQLGHLLGVEKGAEAADMFRAASPCGDPRVAAAAAEAIERLGTALERTSENAEAGDPRSFLALGRALVRVGKRDLGFWYIWSASRSDDPAVATQAASEFGATDPRQLLARLTVSHPQDARFRRDFGYYLLKNNDFRAAMEQFEAALRIDSGDAQTLMQLGYLYEQEGLRPKARAAFAKLAEGSDSSYRQQAKEILAALAQAPGAPREGVRHIASKNALSRNALREKERGFELRRQGKLRAAVEQFERANEIDPSDYFVMRQLGWWYAELKDYPTSEYWFTKAARSPDSSEARAAEIGLQNLRGARRRVFVSTYASPFFTRRFADFIGYSQTKAGLRLRAPIAFEPYLSARTGFDTRSRGGIIPRVFNDNALTLAAGAQVHPFSPNLNLFVEAGASVSLFRTPPAGRGRAPGDFRGGFAYGRGWGRGLDDELPGPRKIAGFRELYSSAEYYSRFGHNGIGYLQWKEGWTLRLAQRRFQAFLQTNLVKDIRGDYYNNVLEFAPSVRLPLAFGPMQLMAQYVRGFYLIRGDRQRNPGAGLYGDVRIMLVFSSWH